MYYYYRNIDSFVNSLTETSIGGNNYFEGLLNNICINKNGLDKINNSTGTINYGGKQIKLNKMTELWIDEANDLPIIYCTAIVKLIIKTKIDCVCVGDKLQSLMYEKFYDTYRSRFIYRNIIYKKPRKY